MNGLPHANGHCLGVLRPEPENGFPLYASMALSRDDRFLFGAGGSTVICWDLPTGAAIWTQTLAGEEPNLTLSPDGQFLPVAYYDSGTWAMLETSTGAVLQWGIAISEYGGIWRLCWLPDSQHFVTLKYAPPNNLGIWHTQSGQLLQSHSIGRSDTYGLASSYSAHLLAVGDNAGQITLLAANTLQVLHTIPTLPQSIWHLAFAPDATRLLVGYSNGTAAIVDLDTGTIRTTITHAGSVRAGDWRSDGQVVATAEIDHPGTIRIWLSDTGQEIQTWHSATFLAPSDGQDSDFGTRNLLWSHKGDFLITGHYNGMIALWDVRDLSPYNSSYNVSAR